MVVKSALGQAIGRFTPGLASAVSEKNAASLSRQSRPAGQVNPFHGAGPVARIGELDPEHPARVVLLDGRAVISPLLRSTVRRGQKPEHALAHRDKAEAAAAAREPGSSESGPGSHAVPR